MRAALVLGLCLVGATRAYSAERVALVIGNSAYEQLPRLVNPVNDASDVTQSLQRVGFQVTTLKDASFEKLRVALLAFSRQAADADMAVVFYAGHGIEVAGENWLLPVDGQLKTDADVNSEAMNLRTVMLAVSDAKTLGLVILDACRNNVFANIVKSGSTRAVDRGLAPVDPAENVLVAYAARDGTTASDGTGRNSPFTSALLRHLETPGLELEFLFRNVRDDVWAATNGGQQPFLYGSLSKDEIYLKPADAPAAVAAAPAPNAPEDPAEASDVAWSFLRNTSDADTLRRFVELFPTSNQVPAARQRVAMLETAQKSDAAPSGIFSLASDDTAQVEEEDIKKTRPYRKSTAAVEAAWDLVKDSKDATVVRRFADRFPSSRRRAAVERRPIQFVGAKVALANPQDPPPQPKLISRDVLLQAAEDPDVLRCFRVDDLHAPECHSALERYPLISQFTYDYRFRFTLCQALGDACGGRPPNMLQNGKTMQAKALFNPINADPAAIAAIPGGVMIAPAATGAGSTPVPPSVPKAPPPPKAPLVVVAPPTPLVTPSPTPTMPTVSYHYKKGTPGHHGPIPTKQTNIAAKSLGATGVKSLRTRVHAGHANSPLKTNLKTNVGVGVKSLKVATPTVKSLHVATPKSVNVATPKSVNIATPKSVTVNTPTVRVVTVKPPTVRVPTVRVPTIRVPTVRVPTVRIP